MTPVTGPSGTALTRVIVGGTDTVERARRIARRRCARIGRVLTEQTRKAGGTDAREAIDLIDTRAAVSTRIGGAFVDVRLADRPAEAGLTLTGEIEVVDARRADTAIETRRRVARIGRRDLTSNAGPSNTTLTAPRPLSGRTVEHIDTVQCARRVARR